MGLVQTLVQNLYYTLLLSALEYPRERLGLELLTDTDADLQELVIWLEDKKVQRQLLQFSAVMPLIETDAYGESMGVLLCRYGVTIWKNVKL